MTIQALINSKLYRDFENTVSENRESAADVLAELMSEYIESQEGNAVIEQIAREVMPLNSHLRPDDTNDLIHRVRRNRTP